MGLFNNLEPALQDIIREHRIKIIDNHGWLSEHFDPVFYFLQVGFHQDNLMLAMDNLMVDHRFGFKDNQTGNAAGHALIFYLHHRKYFAPPPEDDLLNLVKDEPDNCRVC